MYSGVPNRITFKVPPVWGVGPEAVGAADWAGEGEAAGAEDEGGGAAAEVEAARGGAVVAVAAGLRPGHWKPAPE